MRRIRVIPVLLLKNGGLVKSIKFDNYKYVGDPINAVRIFNDKEVDELIVLDITATAQGKEPNISQISEIAGEAFMPLGYGGGVTTINQVKNILYQGVEKIIFNTSAYNNPDLIKEAVRQFGSSSILASIDFKKNLFGNYKIYLKNGTKSISTSPVEYAKMLEGLGVGELFLNSIDNDGTYKGFDLKLLKLITEAVSIPVIACGGASTLNDFKLAVDEGGASAVAAGSMFVFKRPHNAVLISYPSQDELIRELYNLN